MAGDRRFVSILNKPANSVVSSLLRDVPIWADLSGADDDLANLPWLRPEKLRKFVPN
ncbi:MAG: hypothetical protein ABL996_00020 [Micropepsaceae bacterium]